MKRLKIIDKSTGQTFWVYTMIHMDALNDPQKALAQLQPILNAKSITWYDVYFGQTWVTSSEL